MGRRLGQPWGLGAPLSGSGHPGRRPCTLWVLLWERWGEVLKKASPGIASLTQPCIKAALGSSALDLFLHPVVVYPLLGSVGAHLGIYSPLVPGCGEKGPFLATVIAPLPPALERVPGAHTSGHRAKHLQQHWACYPAGLQARMLACPFNAGTVHTRQSLGAVGRLCPWEFPTVTRLWHHSWIQVLWRGRSLFGGG